MNANANAAVYQSRRGFVLIVVLWAVVIVTVIALGFGRRAVLDTTAATYSVDYAQATMLARGAVQRGIIELRNKFYMDQITKLDPPWGTHLGQPWAKPGDLYKDDRFYNSKDRNPRDIAMYKIQDADAYISLALADKKLLANVKAIKPGLLKKLMTRREKETHQGEGPAPFQAVEELRYFPDVDDEVWFGTEKQVGLVNLLTIYSDGLINVNTASGEVLRCVPELDPGTIDRILAFRNGPDGQPGTDDDRGFTGMEDFVAQLGVQGRSLDAIKNYCTFNSSYFIITGTATRQGGKVRASCTATVRIDDSSAGIISWKEDVLGV